MELADEEGYFAALVPKAEKTDCYTVEVRMQDGQIKEVCDPYCFGPVITKKIQKNSTMESIIMYTTFWAHTR